MGERLKGKGDKGGMVVAGSGWMVLRRLPRFREFRIRLPTVEMSTVIIATPSCVEWTKADERRGNHDARSVG